MTLPYFLKDVAPPFLTDQHFLVALRLYLADGVQAYDLERVCKEITAMAALARGP
jgi:hypothetical protein